MGTGIELYSSYREGGRLRWGYTTGSCAAAAAKGAARLLLGGEAAEEVELLTPRGILLRLPLKESSLRGEGLERVAECAVQKDAGDDPDVTDGLLIFASLKRQEQPGICLLAGEGVGRVTLPGLPVPVGEAAINPVPRRMILEALREEMERFGYEGGLSVCIHVPGGEEVAKKTFNPQLGILGGISILGTSGIVEPMSERALLDSLRLGFRQRLSLGERVLLLTPGNYGSDFAREKLGLRGAHALKFSNYVGEAIDYGAELGAEGLLFVAHLGKFVKVAAGIMNTHSHQADARMEILSAALLRAGAGAPLCREILSKNTTEEAMGRIQEEGLLPQVMEVLLERMDHYLEFHSYGRLPVGAIVYTMEAGYLGETKRAGDLLEKIRRQSQEQQTRL